jgi:hypothetical protein
MSVFLRSLGGAAALILVLAASVSAAAPDRFSDGGTIDFAFAECDGFDILAAGSFSIAEADFTNPDGTLREIQQFSWQYELTRSDTGAVVGEGSGRSVLLAPLDGLPDGTYVGVRLFERYVDGSTIAEVGRIVFDTEGEPIFIAGPHPFETTDVDRCTHVQP